MLNILRESCRRKSIQRNKGETPVMIKHKPPRRLKSAVFQRGQVIYVQESTTSKQTSLGSKTKPRPRACGGNCLCIRPGNERGEEVHAEGSLKVEMNVQFVELCRKMAKLRPGRYRLTVDSIVFRFFQNQPPYYEPWGKENCRADRKCQKSAHKFLHTFAERFG